MGFDSHGVFSRQRGQKKGWIELLQMWDCVQYFFMQGFNMPQIYRP